MLIYDPDKPCHLETESSDSSLITTWKITTDFGLINRTYPTDYLLRGKTTQWERFAFYVNTLNLEAGDDVNYKVLFMGRHGDGYHNDAQAYVSNSMTAETGTFLTNTNI